jgi:putative ATPase
MGYGKDYKYPHNFEEAFVPQQYLSKEFKQKYYNPTQRGYEKNIRQYLQKLERLVQTMKGDGKTK